MKIHKKKKFGTFLCLFVLISMILCIKVSAAEFDFETIYTLGNKDVSDSRINIQQIDGRNVMILPSGVTPECVRFFSDAENADKVIIVCKNGNFRFYEGIELNLSELCDEDDYTLGLVYDDGKTHSEYEISFLFSENIPALYIVSDNPTEYGREWIESSYEKLNKTTGRMVMHSRDGNLIYSGELTQIKGRGNSTWSAPKKPYQIKTKSKVDLLGTGNDDNKSKTWVLLANYRDFSLMRNAVSLGLGKALGMEFNIEYSYVDLYYDGEYRGNYMLAEKVESGKGRVNIETSDEKIENPVMNSVKTTDGRFYTYCENSTGTSDEGFLLEMDYEVRAVEEPCYFRTKKNRYVVVKSPEYASKEQMEYISSYYQEFEEAVYSGGVNPYNRKLYNEYVDERSIACYYLVNEFAKARDVFASSAYLYKKSGDDILHMGPLWDYDLSYGKSNLDTPDEESPYGFSSYNTGFSNMLMKIPFFTQLVYNIYIDELYPLVNNIVLNNDTGTETEGLKSAVDLYDEISVSAEYNSKLWYDGAGFADEVEYLRNFISIRLEELKEILPYSSFDDIYVDVVPSEWYYAEVAKATDAGIMNGMGNGFFAPYSFVKRSEVAQVLYNMSETDMIEYEQVTDDIKPNDWYADAVVWAITFDIMDSDLKGMFKPQMFITRENFANAIYRFAGSPEINTDKLSGFDDSGTVSEFTWDAFEWALDKGIFKGDENNCINPHSHLTRAELAALLIRLQNNI